jgi:hypothetical protein
MPLTEKEARALGLPVRRLITWDIENGCARRLQKGESPDSLVYSLDGLEISTKVQKHTGARKPVDVIQCERTGLPLRPLYYEPDRGMVMRAVPISWRVGVPYLQWREAIENADDK